MDISIVIPAFNEEHRIAPTLRAVAAALRGSRLEVEVLVVDDGSTDGTIALVESLGAGIPELRCLPAGPNRGKGHAVRVGMLAATGHVRVMMDADGSIPATELSRLLAPLARGEAAIAIGSRYADGAQTDKAQPAWRVAWSRLANWSIRASLVPGIRDTQCGFKAFTAAAAEELFGLARVDGWAFDLEILALARRLGHPVVEVGVAFCDDERSRVDPLRDLVAVVREWRQIRRNLRTGAYGSLPSIAARAA